MDEYEALDLARKRVQNSCLGSVVESANFGVPVVSGDIAAELTQLYLDRRPSCEHKYKPQRSWDLF